MFLVAGRVKRTVAHIFHNNLGIRERYGAPGVMLLIRKTIRGSQSGRNESPMVWVKSTKKSFGGRLWRHGQRKERIKTLEEVRIGGGEERTGLAIQSPVRQGNRFRILRQFRRTEGFVEYRCGGREKIWKAR